MIEMPNMYVEFGAVIAELGRQPRAAREFFEKYNEPFGIIALDILQHLLQSVTALAAEVDHYLHVQLIHFLYQNIQIHGWHAFLVTMHIDKREFCFRCFMFGHNQC